jgi:hypothetical protein
MVLRGIQHQPRGPARCSFLTRRDLFPLRCQTLIIAPASPHLRVIDPVFPHCVVPVGPRPLAALVVQAVPTG